MLGPTHAALTVASLILGALVFVQQKGGARHRLLGYLYAGTLLLVNVTALSVYKESSALGPFHILALVSLATLSGGFVPAFRRWPRGSWLEAHAYFMSWSYVGLVAAGAAQMATKLAGSGVLQVAAPTALAVSVGAILIHSRIPRILSGFNRRRMRPDDSQPRTAAPLPRICRW